jgi:hypothetical protein
LQVALQSSAVRNVRGLIERVQFIRSMGLDRERQNFIPAALFWRLANEGLRMTPQHLSQLAPNRKYAVLVVAASKLH